MKKKKNQISQVKVSYIKGHEFLEPKLKSLFAHLRNVNFYTLYTFKINSADDLYTLSLYYDLTLAYCKSGNHPLLCIFYYP